MNRIVFTEGFNDLIFLQRVYRQTAGNHRYRLYDNNATQDSQTQKIRWHRYDSQFQFLFKAEGGRPSLLTILADESLSIVDSPLKMNVLIDLDGDNVSTLIEELNREYWDIVGNSIEVILGNREYHNGFLELEGRILYDGSMLDSINIISFDTSMESEVNMQHSASTHSKISAADTYIQNNPKKTQTIAGAFGFN